MTARIDYKQLRRINPEAARRAVLDYLRSSGHNIAKTAAVFGINRPVLPYGRMTSSEKRGRVIYRIGHGRQGISRGRHQVRSKTRSLRPRTRHS
jgi:hypothetical protein